MKKEQKLENSTEQILTMPVASGSFYWVKPYKGEDYEPAKCRDYYQNGRLYFCFTNGSIMDVDRVQDYNQIFTQDQCV